MDATQLVFGIKDVIGIIIGVISMVGFLFMLKRNSEVAQSKTDEVNADLQQFKRDAIIHITECKNEIEKKELQLTNRIEQVRAEHRDDHEKLWNKLDTFEKIQQSVLTSLAELTGYLRAKKDN